MTDWLKIVNHPVFNVAFFLLVRQLTKWLDLDNPSYTATLRTIYLSSQLLVILLSFYLMSIIKRKNDQTVLKYVMPGSKQLDGTETPAKLVVTNHMDYDIEQVKTQMNSGFTGLAMVAFLHLKFGYVQPLIMQSVLSFKTFFATKEARIHFLGGNTTRGELRRPFAVDSLPFGLGGNKNQPITDKGAIKKLEKAEKAH